MRDNPQYILTSQTQANQPPVFLPYSSGFSLQTANNEAIVSAGSIENTIGLHKKGQSEGDGLLLIFDRCQQFSHSGNDTES